MKILKILIGLFFVLSSCNSPKKMLIKNKSTFNTIKEKVVQLEKIEAIHFSDRSNTYSIYLEVNSEHLDQSLLDINEFDSLLYLLEGIQNGVQYFFDKESILDFKKGSISGFSKHDYYVSISLVGYKGVFQSCIACDNDQLWSYFYPHSGFY